MSTASIDVCETFTGFTSLAFYNKYMFLDHTLQESIIRNAFKTRRQTVQGIFRPVQEGVEYERYQLKMEKIGK